MISQNANKGSTGIAPLYLWHGECHFLLKEALDNIIAALDTPGFKEFNVHRFRAGETPIGSIITATEVSPMMCPHRLVVVYEGDRFSKDELQQLLSYSQNPVKTTVLIVIFKKLDMRKTVFRALSKKAVVQCFTEPYESKLPLWIIGRLKRQGITMTEDAAQFLVDRVGGNIGELAMELEKLCLWAHQNKEISLEMVESIAGDVKRHTIFQLTDSIGERAIPQAIKALHNLLLNGVPPLLILSMVTRHIRNLLKTREVLERKGVKQDVAQAIAIQSPFIIQKYMVQAGNFTLNELKKHLTLLANTDHKIKTSTASPTFLLEELIFQMGIKSAQENIKIGLA